MWRQGRRCVVLHRPFDVHQVDMGGLGSVRVLSVGSHGYCWVVARRPCSAMEHMASLLRPCVVGQVGVPEGLLGAAGRPQRLMFGLQLPWAAA